MSKINIQFTLFSAFYSPLISTMTGGFLKDEGLDYEWSVAKPGVTAITALDNGSADVVQSTLSQGFNTLNKGETPTCVHFAQINEMDGFFITGRDAEPDFSWKKLEGAEVLVHHGGQPMTMFKYACYKAGIDINKINIIDAGSGGEMDAAFRAGTGQYIHQQGPAPQQLAADGVGQLRITTVLYLIEEVAAVQRKYPAIVVGVEVEAGIEYLLVGDESQVTVGIGRIVAVGVIDA